MDPMHSLAGRMVAGLLPGSLALSARPDAPVLPDTPSRRLRARRSTAAARRTIGRVRHIRRPGVGRPATLGG